jgi:ABC-type phosphate transport system permease subunit
MAIINTFLSYLMLLLVIVIVAGCGVFLGLFLRKLSKKDSITESQENTAE